MAKEKQVSPETRGELQRRTPSRAMSPFEELDRMFESVFPRGWLRPFGWEPPAFGEALTPRVDVIDRDEEIVVRAEIPGVNKEDLDVSLNGQHVTIRGTTRSEHEEEKGDYYRCEISRGAFSRTVTLPGEVDGDKAKATFKDGMLELTIPKVERSRRQSIKVE